MNVLLKAAAAALVLSSGFARASHAMDIVPSGSVLHVPNSSYHYFAYDLSLRLFDDGKRAFQFQAGGTPPFHLGEYSYFSNYLSVCRIHEASSSILRIYGGVGLGIYTEQLNAQWGVFPGISMTGGARIGGKNVGLQFGVTSQIAIGKIPQLLVRVLWPFSVFTGGVYVAF